MEDYEPGPYRTFNDFFIRRFKPQKRKFLQGPGQLPAFAEGRYLAFENITEEQKFPVKGQFLRVQDLLDDQIKARQFEGGPMVIARLCPVDYHRFHFPDDGEILDHWSISGRLHSVNPVALEARPNIFITNERQVTLLKTKNLGILAYIEVGALCVGKIIQTYAGRTFKRGDEKGYFLFGGSTVILLGEKGSWKPNADMLKRSSMGLETYIHLGDGIGLSLR